MKKNNSKHWQTAAEYMKQRQADPEWVRLHQEREAQFEAVSEQLAREEKPILDDLASTGLRVNSVWDLVNTRTSYASAIPTLMEHLQRPYHPRIVQGIARALTIDEARGIAGNLVLDELLQRADSPGSETRWTLANALTVIADNSMIDRIESILRDPCYDDVQERLAVALKQARRC